MLPNECLYVFSQQGVRCVFVPNIIQPGFAVGDNEHAGSIVMLDHLFDFQGDCGGFSAAAHQRQNGDFIECVRVSLHFVDEIKNVLCLGQIVQISRLENS